MRETVVYTQYHLIYFIIKLQYRRKRLHRYIQKGQELLLICGPETIPLRAHKLHVLVTPYILYPNILYYYNKTLFYDI